VTKHVVAAALAFVSLAAVAVAGSNPRPVTSGPVSVHSPAPVASMKPISVMTPIAPIALPSGLEKSRYVHGVRPGTKVPLFRLPHVPLRTAMNSIVPGKGHHGGRYHPFASTGASIVVTANAACTTGGTVGDLFNVGCQLTMTAQNLQSTTDTYQDYVVPPNAVTATAACATYVGNADPGCTNATTLLSQQGTYALLVYDTTTQVFVAAVFVNAGQVFTITVFQDPFHTEQAYQFDTSSSVAAYVYLQNVAPSDHYVVYVYSTGVNVYCAYLTPAGSTIVPTPRPSGAPNTLLCNPSTANVTGVQAPGGNLSLTWAMSSALESGSYSILVYDQDANGGTGQTLGQVQVSLTSGGAAVFLEGCTAAVGGCANINPSPGPNGPASSTILAWDATTDQSVGGVYASLQEVVTGSTYRWSVNDPQGAVFATSAPQVVPTPTGDPNPVGFSFNTLGTSPGFYPAPIWVMELFDTIAKKVEGSQSFKLVGYHMTTSFVYNGHGNSNINFATGGACQAGNLWCQTVGLQFINDSNIVFNGSGDSFGQGTNPAIEFATGDQNELLNTFAPPGTAHCTTPATSCGTTFTLPSCAGAYNSAGGCVQTTGITDTNGNAWTATEWCNTANPNTQAGWATNNSCVLQVKPQSSSVVLSPGASITINNVNFYAEGGNGAWPCYNTPCFAYSSELPTHGLSWSVQTNSANPTAWTPVSFGSNIGSTIAGTARFDYVGSRAQPPAFVAQGATPWTSAHYWQSNFTRAAYQRSTPFSATRTNAMSILITNNSTDNIVGGHNPGLAIGFPSYITPSQVTVDANSTGTWTKVACPSSFGTTYVCLNSSSNIAAGGTATLVLDVPPPISSFGFQELTIQAWENTQLLWFTLSNDGSTQATIDQCGSTCQGEPAGGNVDSLGIAAYSLNSGLMSAAFTPSTVASGLAPLPLTIVVQNATTAADPNPDAIDAVVIEERGLAEGSAKYAVSGVPTMTRQDGQTWSYLGAVGPAGTSPANTIDYWYAVGNACGGNWGTLSGGPPQPAGLTTPLSAQYPLLAKCGASESKSLWNDSAHSSATINMSLVGPLNAGVHTFYMYAHGANGGGWSAAKFFTVNVTAESASAGFQSIGAGATCPGSAVAVNALPIVNGVPNCFIYTVKNTSASSSIGTVDITLPAYDINGLAAGSGAAGSVNSWSLVGSPITQNIKVGTISGGVFTTVGAPTGCAVSAANTVDPTPGSTNGKIEISGCTGLTTGKTLAVEFQANAPSTQGSTYLLPSTLDPSGANVQTGATWLGDQNIQVQFAVGLSVVVAPLSNPGPGGSTPTSACGQCAFSGTTIDFGSIAAAGSVTATDVSRATVVYAGSCASSCFTWQLQVNAIGTAQAIGEISTAMDTTNSTSGLTAAGGLGTCGAVYPTNCFFPMPTSATQIMSGPEQTRSSTCSSGSTAYCYDTVNDYKISVGADTSGHIVTVVYTLIAN
jgi:hypothetical protein